MTEEGDGLEGVVGERAEELHDVGDAPAGIASAVFVGNDGANDVARHDGVDKSVIHCHGFTVQGGAADENVPSLRVGKRFFDIECNFEHAVVNTLKPLSRTLFVLNGAERIVGLGEHEKSEALNDALRHLFRFDASAMEQIGRAHV